MNDAFIIGALFSVIQAAFFLWVKASISKVEQIDSKLIHIQLLVANEYVKKSELKEHLERIEGTLDELKNFLMKKP